jgi:hypothetical protein
MNRQIPESTVEEEKARKPDLDYEVRASQRRMMAEPPSKIAGTIEVGHNDDFEVVINMSIKDFKVDGNGIGHLCFSPKQARHLANLIMKHTTEALVEWREDQRKRYEQANTPR